MEELRSLNIASQRGDRQAFGHIVMRFQDMAYAVAYAVVDSALAQDAAQEAFIDAYLSLPSLREPTAIPGWFRRLLIKHGDRQIRRKRPPTVPIEAAGGVAATTIDPATAIADLQIKRAVHEAIAALPETQRLVTMLFYVEGHCLKEITEFIELPTPTIKMHLYTARKRLKERIWLFLYVISAGIHVHSRLVLHESSSYSRG
jgi:RNA polymerase sigma factor (sigma-70 family)